MEYGTLKIKQIVGGKETNFRNIEVKEYTYTKTRMGFPSLTATIYYTKPLDKEWKSDMYVEIEGVKLFIRETPDSTKSNDNVLYEHSITFRSEYEILDGVYFYDSVSVENYTDDKPQSESTSVTFFGTLEEFVRRINASLVQSNIGDSAIKNGNVLYDDSDINGDGFVCVLARETDFSYDETEKLTFDDLSIWEAIKQVYDTFEVTFSLREKKIIFGEINETLQTTFEYGREKGLLEVERANSNNKVINRVTFVGGETNIPHYYPNDSEYGTITLQGTGKDKVEIKNQFLLLGSLDEEQELVAITQKGSCYFDLSYNKNISADGFTTLREDPGVVSFGVGLVVSKYSYKAKISKLSFDYKVSYKQFYWEEQPHYSDGIYTPTYRKSWLDCEKEYTVDYVQSANTTSEYPKIYAQKISDDTKYEATFEKGSLTFGVLPVGAYRIMVEDNLSQLDIENEPNISGARSVAMGSCLLGGSSEKVVVYSVDGTIYEDLSTLGLSGTLDVGETLSWKSGETINTQSKLMPPIYRETKGKERFYNAINNYYKNPDTGDFYTFPTPYVDGNPIEYIYTNEDIYPTIKNVKNAAGDYIGEIVDIAFDEDDNDNLKASVNDDGELEAANYEHSYFYIKLHLTDGDGAFNLFDCAMQEDNMTVCITSGSCNGCEFPIQVAKFTNADGVYFFKNPVLVNEETGDIVEGNYSDKVLGETVAKSQAQDCQQDTSKKEVWICVQKDIETFGVLMPNATNKYRPKIGDTFVLKNILLPKVYITTAEEMGYEEAIRYMAENNEEKFNYNLKMSRVYLKNHPSILDKLSEYSKLKIKYNDTTVEQYVSTITVSVKKEEALPEISVDLVDEVSVGESFQKEIASSVEAMIANTVTVGGVVSGSGSGTALTTTQLSDRFLRKDKDDTSEGVPTFQNGQKNQGNVTFGDFISSVYIGRGAVIRPDGTAEFESIKVRSDMEVANLIVNGIEALENDAMLSDSATIEKIVPLSEDDTTSSFGLYLKSKWDGWVTGFKEYDVVKGIFNSLSAGSSGEYFVSWFRVNQVNAALNYIEVTMYPADEVPAKKNYTPQVNMNIARWGNQVDEDRQSCLYLSSTEGRIVKLTGVTKPILEDYNYGTTMGTLPEFVQEIPKVQAQINPNWDYMYAAGIICQSFIQVDYEGKPISEYVDRGEWVEGESYYCSDINPSTGKYEISLVYHNGCKWQCNKTGATDEPKWNTTQWSMIEGNTQLKVEFLEQEQIYDMDDIQITLTPIVTLYNEDITDQLVDTDFEWTRYSVGADGNERPSSDTVWALEHADTGKQLKATVDDLGVDSFGFPKKVVFTCTVTVKDGLVSSASLEI